MANSTPLASTAPREHAELTRILTTELAGESLELPSFPEVALRVRKALANADIAVDDVVRMVSAEPSLAVRLLQISNSAALNPGGQRITSLRIAIARIGFDLARSATIAFAMSQMRRAEAWRGLETRFKELWDQSAQLAAMSYAVAKRARGVPADQAMLAGMLHAVGKLFVLTRISRFPVLLNTPELYFELEQEWHGRMARAILTRWEVGPDIIAAACDYQQAGQQRPGPADLRDVLFAARYIGTLPPAAAVPDPAIFSAPPFQRLGLDPDVCGDLLQTSAAEIASLRAALVD
jgi:HD-like signal output (HDOD) protein